MYVFVKSFIPQYHFSDVTEIEEKVFAGKELLVFDIDNTLFYPESTVIRKDILAWLQELKKKYRCIGLSNSFTLKKRRDKIEKILGIPVFGGASKKPSKKLFRLLQDVYPYKAKNMVMIGDMRLTDVWFGNRNGMHTVLVDPLADEVLFILKVERIFENFLVWFLSFFLRLK